MWFTKSRKTILVVTTILYFIRMITINPGYRGSAVLFSVTTILYFIITAVLLIVIK